jgi:ABC-type transporter Mla subunit MlaD
MTDKANPPDANPFEALLRAQREAMQGFSDAAQSLAAAGSSGGSPGQPVDMMGQLSGMSATLGALAAGSIRPLQELLESQRQFADTMASFAEMHRQMAELLESVATRQRAAVDAASTLLAPLAALGKEHL